VYNQSGEGRPDVARIGGLTIASLGALMWRPEGASPREASTFVVTRVGSGLVVAAIRRGLSSKQRDQH